MIITNVLAIAKDENTFESLAGVPTVNDALGIDIDEIDVRYVLFTKKGFIEQYPDRYETLFNALKGAFENSEYLKKTTARVAISTFRIPPQPPKK